MSSLDGYVLTCMSAAWRESRRPTLAWRTVCRRCQHGRMASVRFYSEASASALSPPPPPPSGIAPLDGTRRLISVAGPDAAKYLQGVITANMQRLAPSGSAAGLYAGFLNAQGRLLHDVFVYRDTLGVAGGTATTTTTTTASGTGGDGAFLIEVDAAEAVTLEKHIRRFKLRAAFAVRLLAPGEVAVWHGWGVPAPGPGPTTPSPQERILLVDPRAPDFGWRLLRRGTAEEATGDVSVDEAPASAYQIWRYLHGVAEGQTELLLGQALPLESNLDVMGAIDFRKGCYVGQELTIRTKHRGVVRKRVLPCVVGNAQDSLAYASGLAATIPATTNIQRAGRKGRSAGKWLAGVGNIGLALCRLETMTDVVLPGEAVGATASAAAAASDPANAPAFVHNVGSPDAGVDATAPQLPIRAFVPDWLRQGLTSTEQA